MAATTPAMSGEEFSITVVEPTAQAAGDEEVPLRESSELQQRRRESSADMVRRKLERLNQIVFCVAFLEWAGNAIGTLAFIWATVILLGGFSSLLNTTDFWFCTVMIFMEASRVFIRNDASVNQWLFGSTRAFRWENLSFPRMFVPPKYGNVIAVIIGVGISLTPLEFHPQIAASILKVILLVVISQLLARLRQGRSLVRDLEFRQDWGPKAVNLYHHQVYQARTERGLFPSEKHTPSLTSFAIESLGNTSSEMQQLVGLHVLHNFLERWDSESKNKLITEIIHGSKNAVPNLIDMLGSTTVARYQDIRLLAATITNEISGNLKISKFPGMLKMVSSLLDAENRQDSMLNHVSENNGGSNVECQLIEKLFFRRRIRFYLLGLSMLEKLTCDPDNCAQIAKDATNIITKIIGLIAYLTDKKISGESEIQQKMMVYDSALKFVRRLAIKGGKIGMRFRRELSENSFFLNSLERILDLEDRQPELWEPVMDIIAKLALDKAAGLEIGSTQSILRKLVHGFLRPDDVTYLSRNNDPSSLQMIAGETLANLTIMSVDNCWAILWAEPGRHNLIEMITSMLENECCICVAATLLHNLCANSRDKLIDLGANAHLESALTKVMQIIRTSEEGKQLEAALCVASQIGYVIPEYFTQVLESCTDAAATELVEKLVDTLSNREPSLEYPRIRRVLVEVVISIVDLSPGYIKIFREKGAKDALDIVKGTPSRLEKYMVFLDGEGVVTESLPMRDLVDKAKSLIYQATPTRGAQPVDHP